MLQYHLHQIAIEWVGQFFQKDRLQNTDVDCCEKSRKIDFQRVKGSRGMRPDSLGFNQ